MNEPNEPIVLNDFKATLNYSTFFGGTTASETGEDLAIGEDGSCFITGGTSASDFPTLNAYDDSLNGDRDAYIARFSANGSLLWSTYLGGDETETALGIALTDDLHCYVVGYTESTNFPTLNAYDSTFNGTNDIFISKFDATGSLLWSTYLGGNLTASVNEDVIDDIALGSDDSCYLTGHTKCANFPTKNADNATHGGIYDIFVTKFSAGGSLLWSIFLGSNDTEIGQGIAVASDNSCYITGSTGSMNFPTMNAYSLPYPTTFDAIIAKYSSGGDLLWSNRFGGDAADVAHAITITSDNKPIITGQTLSSDFPTLNAYDDTKGLYDDVFVSEFDTDGALLWSTFLGGHSGEYGYDIACADDDSIYLTGVTYSSDFPTKNAYNSTLGTDEHLRCDVFVTKFSKTKSLLWSTFLGGTYNDYGLAIDVGEDDSCCVTGYTYSDYTFPLKNAYAEDRSSNNRILFLTKFNNVAFQSSNGFSASSYLAFILGLPILVVIIRKRRKK